MEFSFGLITCLIYSGLNLLAFAVFAYDKLMAKVRMARSPENFLLLIAVPGPAGALAAMVMFRHKTRHTKFLLVPVFLFFHLLLICWMWPAILG